MSRLYVKTNRLMARDEQAGVIDVVMSVDEPSLCKDQSFDGS